MNFEMNNNVNVNDSLLNISDNQEYSVLWKTLTDSQSSMKQGSTQTENISIQCDLLSTSAFL